MEFRFNEKEQTIFDERTGYHRSSILDVIASGIGGPTLLRVGTEEQKKEWLPGIAAGEVNTEQGPSFYFPIREEMVVCRRPS